MSDGIVYANMRSRQGRNCRASAWSRNGGETWSEVEYDPALPEPSCQGSIVRFDTDRVLLAHPSHIDKRAGLTVRLSQDNCRTWPVSRVLEPWGASYSDLAVTDDRSILCFYEARPGYNDGARPSPSGRGGGGRSTLRLVLARFGIEWVENTV